MSDSQLQIISTGLAAQFLAQTVFGQAAIKAQEEHGRYRARMRAVGVPDQEVADHDEALISFARSTIWPNSAVITQGREMARRAVSAGGRIIPSDSDVWAARIAEPFFTIRTLSGQTAFTFGEYAEMLPAIRATARAVWAPLIERYPPRPKLDLDVLVSEFSKVTGARP